MHREIRAPVSYLPEYLYQEPWRVWRAWWQARRRPGYRAAWHAWFKDLCRDRSANRVRRFGQALVLAKEMPAGIAHLHAHFIHTPASVARYAAMLRGLPWSCSAHAKDIWTTPDWDKREKLAEMRWLVTCTAIGQNHLAALAPTPDRVQLVYHGLDLRRFSPPPARGADEEAPDGTNPKAPARILSVGRAVEKKGFDDLIDALARLPSELAWRFIHIGGGPMLESLRAMTRRLGIAERMTWLGAQPQDIVLQHYRDADLFVLASRVAGDGDRDGLPNVLMEALSQRVAVVATKVGGVPELIEDQETGLLVEPRDIAALADALAGLIGDPRRRAQLGSAGESRVRRRFDLESGIDQLSARFGVIPTDSALRDPPCA
ncbi:MAG: glycosyltransferase family 4 protein [Dongiaceae bacterium]